ncbi:MAG: peptidoglycan-binding domain-containing protein, partial [Thermomonas sp.]
VTDIDAKLVDVAANEVLPPSAARAGWPWLAAAAVVAIAALAVTQFHRMTPTAPAPALSQPQSASATKPLTPTSPAPVDMEKTPGIDAAGLTQLIGATGDTPVPGWQSMLKAWRLPADSITVDPAGPCSPAAHPEVHCVAGNARLDTLLALDRPVLLRLHDAGAEAWALLLGVDPRRARIRIGGRTQDIDRVLLQSHWKGDFVTLWRGPAMLSTPPLPGGQGEAVDWLWEQVSPGANVAPGRAYDDALRNAVTTLQDARGLPADGIAGPLTLMALASELPGPHLQRVLD